MPKIVIDFGKQGVPPVELSASVVGGDYDIFGSVFNSKVLVGIKYESFKIQEVKYWKRIAIDIFQLGTYQKISSIQSVYPVLPVVPDSELDPKRSLYSSYKEKLDNDPNKCISDYRGGKFSTIFQSDDNQNIYDIDPTSNIEGTSDKFEDWIKGNNLSSSKRMQFSYKTVKNNPSGCDIISNVVGYIDDRPSLNIPEEKRSRTKIILALPFEG